MLKNYIICTVQRSGKSWIAETLNMLGLGYAIELLTEFHQYSAPEQELLQSQFDVEGMHGLIKHFVKYSIKSGAPCTSITLQWSDFDAKDDFEIIYHKGRVEKLRALVNGLSPCTVFFLQRRDVLAQSISHLLASKSGYYHSTCPKEKSFQRACVYYKRSDIERYLNYTRRCYTEWENLFTLSNIAPKFLFYEDFVENPVEYFGKLADQIAGRSLNPEIIKAAYISRSKVSDEMDISFRARYMAGE